MNQLEEKAKQRLNSILLGKENLLLQHKIKTRGINKSFLDKEIKECSDCGILEKNRDVQLIVSLTSFPERMNEIHYCLFSLLKQSMKPDKIILWLGYEEFINLEKDIPKEVLDLKKFGLTIEFTHDIKSYKKLIPALKKYPDAIIVTADDDLYYENKWLENLYEEYKANKTDIICHRAHKIKIDNNGNFMPYCSWSKEINDKVASVFNFPTSGAGILFPPNSFCTDVLDENIFLKICPNADDIWFWAMLVLNDKKIKLAQKSISKLTYINPKRDFGLTNELTLYSTNIVENDDQLGKLLAQYPMIMKIVRNSYE